MFHSPVQHWHKMDLELADLLEGLEGSDAEAQPIVVAQPAAAVADPPEQLNVLQRRVPGDVVPAPAARTAKDNQCPCWGLCGTIATISGK